MGEPISNFNDLQIIQQWIDGLKNYIIGTLRWTQESGRYTVKQNIQELNYANNNVDNQSIIVPN